jgi:MYXO-CTERM domain-containing protein
MLSGSENVDTGDERGPKIATDGQGNWVVVWYATGTALGTGDDMDIFVSRSSDNGTTWSNAIPLNTNALTDDASDRDIYPEIATDVQGNWMVVWTIRNSNIVRAVSTDNGASWSDPMRWSLGGDPVKYSSGNAPKIIMHENGSILVAWRSSDYNREDPDDIEYGSFDIDYRHSMDSGATWSSPAELGPNRPEDDYTKDSGLNLAMDGNGNCVAVWTADTRYGSDFSNSGFRSHSSDFGRTWSVREAATWSSSSVFTDAAGNWVCLVNNRNRPSPNDRLRQHSVDSTGATWYPSESLVYPGLSQLSNDAQGNWVGLSGNRGDQAAHSDANLDEWSITTPIKLEGSSYNYNYDIASDGQGHWVVVWTDWQRNPNSTDDDLYASTLVIRATVHEIEPETEGPTNMDAINFTVTFSDPVSNFNDLSDLVIKHDGTASTGASISGGPTEYVVAVEGVTGDGAITLAANMDSDVVNSDGNPLAGDIVVSAPVAIDNTAPTVELSPPSLESTSNDDVTYIISYDLFESIDFAIEDVTINATGTATARISSSTYVSSNERKAVLQDFEGEGTIGISVAAGTALDEAGNGASAIGPSATFFVDTAGPTPMIGAPSISETRVGPVTYIVSYEDPETLDFDNFDVNLLATGDATALVTVSGEGNSRIVTLDEITGDGTLGISINARTATDNLGNDSPASAESETFTVDNTPPSLSIGPPSASSTTSEPVSYTVTYTDAITITLQSGDVNVLATGSASGTPVVTGSGDSRTVTIEEASGIGTLRISINADTAVDSVGNSAPVSQESETFGVDNIGPELSISAPSSNETNTDPVSFTLTYVGVDVITLSSSDVILDATGDASATISVSGSGDTRTITLNDISGNGTLAIRIPAGTATTNSNASAPAAGPSATFVVTNEGNPVGCSASSGTTKADSRGDVFLSLLLLVVLVLHRRSPKSAHLSLR